MTLWGTPKWANGDKGRNYLPTSTTDFQDFAKAVATATRVALPGSALLRNLERVQPGPVPVADMFTRARS